MSVGLNSFILGKAFGQFKLLGCIGCRTFSLSSVTQGSRNDEASVVLSHGLPRFNIPLPSREEVCIFTMRPLSNTVGDLIRAIQEEDKGIDRIAFLSPDGLRFAKANSIELLLANNFDVQINDKTFPINVSNLGVPAHVTPSELGSVRALVSKLNAALSADDVNAEKEREIKKRIDDILVQLEPLEEKRLQLSTTAAERTRRLTWLGLGAMGLQFGLLARLTWWEYSWDIMEPVTYFVGYGTTMAIYAYYVVTRQDFAFPQVFDREYLKSFYAKSRAQGFDVERYNTLCDRLAEFQSDLKRLQDPLYLNLPLQQTNMLVKEQLQKNISMQELNSQSSGSSS